MTYEWRPPEAVTLTEIANCSHWLCVFKSLHPFEEVVIMRLVRSVDSKGVFTDDQIYDLNMQTPWNASAFCLVRPVNEQIMPVSWVEPWDGPRIGVRQ